MLEGVVGMEPSGLAHSLGLHRLQFHEHVSDDCTSGFHLPALVGRLGVNQRPTARALFGYVSHTFPFSVSCSVVMVATP